VQDNVNNITSLPIHHGIFHPGTTYPVNAITRHANAAWMATADTRETPSHASADWNLLCQDGGRGRKGMRGVDGTGVTNIYIDDGFIVFTLSDGSEKELDAQQLIDSLIEDKTK